MPAQRSNPDELRERAGNSQPIQIGGRDLILRRKTLNHAIGFLDSGRWERSCETRLQPSHDSVMRRTLSRDLGILGSWPSPGAP